MHELSVCSNILDIIEKNAQQHLYQQVKKIMLQVGEYACIESSALRFCFSVSAKGTCAQDAELAIEITPGNEIHIKEIEVM